MANFALLILTDFFIFSYASVRTIPIDKNIKTPARLVYNGKSYVESWPYYEGEITHKWLEIIPEGSKSKFLDVIHPDTLLERIGKQADDEVVNDALCLFDGDQVTHVQCEDLCKQIDHPNVLDGGCLNNVCCCSWYMEDENYQITYLSLKSSAHITVPTIENFIKESRRDASRKATRTKPRPPQRVKYTPDGLFKIPPPPSSESENEADKEDEDDAYDYKDFMGFSDEELEESPKRTCMLTQEGGIKELHCGGGEAKGQRPGNIEKSYMSWENVGPTAASTQDQCRPSSPPKEPEPSCGNSNLAADCSDHAEEIKCHYGQEIISQKECYAWCLLVGDRTDVKVTYGYCEDDHCTCFYNSNQSCKKSKLTNLEKRPLAKKRSYPPSQPNLRFHEGSNDSLCPRRPTLSREHSH